MEQRHQKRIIVGYKAEIIYNGKAYECVIENLSPTGVNIIITSTAPEFSFNPQETIDLRFESHPGETVTLACRVKWSRKTKPHGLTDRVGLEITDPSWEQSNYIV